jgi:pyrroline-5-carboxylate reductase
MANAIMGGIINAGLCGPEEIIGADVIPEAREKTGARHGIMVTAENTSVLDKADIVFLAVKPQFYESVIREIRDFVREDQVFISIAAGWPLQKLENAFGRKVKAVRVMPNTPAMVGEGMSAACPNEQVTDQEMEQVMALLSSFGRAEQMPERLFDAVIASSGSGPAYVYMFIEALADAAVMEGMPRKQAYAFSAQTVLGAAKMVLETGMHPGELKDMVCSPAGTTIEAVRVLEEKNLRSAVIEGAHAAAEKAREMV